MEVASMKKAFGLKWRSSTSFIVATVGVGLFTDLFLYGLVVPALPFILSDRFDLPADQTQRHVSILLAVYSGASVVFSPIVGVITDRLSSRKSPFLLGVASLFGATVLLMLGRTMPVLLIARALQGTSAALVWTTGMALCVETVGAHNLGKALGSIFGCITIGTLMAPMVGGVLYDKGGNAALFGLAFAMLAIDFSMRILVIERKTAAQYEQSAENDTNGASGPDTDESSGTAGQEEGQCTEEQSLLVRTQDKEENVHYKLAPELPKIVRAIPILSCLASSRLLASLLISFFQGLVIGSIDATVPLVSRDYYNFTSINAGLMFLPIGITNLIFGPILGWCVDRLGTKMMATVLYTYLVPVLVAFRLAAPGGPPEVAKFAILLALAGIGLAGMAAPSLVEGGKVVYLYHQANPDFYGEYGPYAQLYSLFNIAYSLGLAVGPLMGGSLKQAIGYGNMNAVLAGLCGVTAMVCYIFVGERSGRKVRENTVGQDPEI
ncbi:hypothetical protein PspLS_10357 [Pyricularia sp. CBS 133598]|nr:hypothetical protein PspLS_10357 [Pyricularia sp. CBS 133598]